MQTNKLAYSIAEAAEQVCVSTSTIRREIDAGRLAVRYVGTNPPHQAFRARRMVRRTPERTPMTIRLRYTRKEAAAQLCISTSKLDELRNAGKVAPRYDGRTVYYDHDELLSYVKSLPSERR